VSVAYRVVIGLVLLLAGGAALSADHYGNLFTTPEQRAWLDANRERPGQVAQPTPGDAVAQSVQPQPIKLNGTLISNGQAREVWINGQAQLKGSANGGDRLRVLGRDRVQIRRSPAEQPYLMKPGQVLDPASGRVSESYQQAVGRASAALSPDNGDE
jgi:hypothetical protein